MDQYDVGKLEPELLDKGVKTQKPETTRPLEDINANRGGLK